MNRIVLLVCGFLAVCCYASPVLAQHSDGDQGGAYAHAAQVSSAVAACAQANACSGKPYSACEPLPLGSPISGYSSRISSSTNTCHIATSTIGGCATSCQQPSQHNFTGFCSDRADISFTAQVSGAILDSGVAGNACIDGCGYSGAVGDGVCAGFGDPPSYWCPLVYTASGSPCDPATGESAPAPSDPPGGSYDCTNTQCGPPGTGTDPDDGILPPDPGPDQTPGDTSTDGGAGPGDGDSTTGGSGGSGGAQTEGECDPFSNPDCPFTGSASSSSSCNTVPSCTGEPAQCETLRQVWRSQCYAWTDTGAPLPQWTVPAKGSIRDAFALEPVDVGAAGVLDEAGFLGGGSCPDIPSVTAVGQVFAIDGTVFCTALEWIGALVVIGAALGSMRILFGGGGILG